MSSHSVSPSFEWDVGQSVSTVLLSVSHSISGGSNYGDFPPGITPYRSSYSLSLKGTPTKAGSYAFIVYGYHSSPHYDYYARCSAKVYATVTFNPGDGVCETTSLRSYSTITLPEASKKGTEFVKYNFLGWYSAQTEGTLIGKAGASYTVSVNETLYARFEQVNTYTCMVNVGGEYYPAQAFVNCNGAWYQSTPYTCNGDSWHKLST